MRVGNLDIGYVTEIAQEYQAMLDAADSLETLKDGLTHWDPFVWMDSRSVENWDGKDFLEFKKFLKHERSISKSRKKETATEEDMAKYSPIIMPMPMLDISMMASKFFAPFGTMLIRGVELGRYTIKNERVIVNKSPS